MTPELLAAPGGQGAGELAELNAEYLAWAMRGLQQTAMAHGVPGAGADDALVERLCRLQPPLGCFYLVRVQGQPVGMGGLRRHDDGWGEIKRLYVRPGWRGQGLASALLVRLIQEAHDFGCPGLRLDTAPFMQAAERLYRKHGFVDCGPYPGTEVPPGLQSHWRFMHRHVANLSLSGPPG